MDLYHLLFILLGIVSCTVARQSIINGEFAKKHQFPYQVSIIYYNHGRGCGGGIIREQFILTAAHCVLTDDHVVKSNRIRIIAGSIDLSKTDKSTMSVEVEKAYLPTEYQSNEFYSTGDIAVFKLRHRLDFHKHKHLKALELPKDNRDMYIGKRATIAGFGWDWILVDYIHRTRDGGYKDALLRYTETTVISPGHQCYPPGNFCHDKHLFARSDQHLAPRGVCFGDSGGPLVHDGKTVIGVLSISPFGCVEKDHGASYTRVSAYLDFIDDAIHDRRNDKIHHYVFDRWE